MKNIILEKYLHIGDKVLVAVDPESRSWGFKAPEDGTKATVVGFYRYRTAYGYNQQNLYKAGFYESNSVPILMLEDGTECRLGASNLMFAENHDAVMEERQKQKQYHEAFEAKIKTADLPELPYMEGDTVRLWTSRFNDEMIVRICRIDYDNYDKFCNDGVTPYPIYHVSPTDSNGVSTAMRASDFHHVVNHGNYWNLKNNQPLKFNDLKEEAAFYMSLGRAEQIKSPQSGNYRWGMTDAINAVRERRGDLIKMSGSLFGSRAFPLVYKFRDLPDLSARLQTETIEGFKDWKPEMERE